MSDLKYLSADECRDREIIEQVRRSVAHAESQGRSPMILLGEAKAVLRLAKIGVEAERLYNSLRPRDDDEN